METKVNKAALAMILIAATLILFHLGAGVFVQQQTAPVPKVVKKKKMVSFETIKEQGNVVVSNYDRSSTNWSELSLEPFEAMAVQFV